MPDFVGADKDSQDGKCPAVFRDPTTGDFYQQGRIVTDPQMLKGFAEHTTLADDEAVVWQPANMAEALAEAATGSYEQGRTGPGFPSYEELFANAKRSAVHLEMRDTYAAPGDDPAFDDWLAGGTGEWDRSRWEKTVTTLVGRGVKMRRLRLVSEPLSDYVRWEHAFTHQNIEFGEDVRWLPRRHAVDLLFPGADFWMFDQRLVLFNFNAGNGTELPDETGVFITDPRKVRQIVATFEMAWERAIPHEDYKLT